MKELALCRLGRGGDVIATLPLLKHLSETGPRPTLLVSEPYSCIGQYCSYFDQEVLPCAFEDCIKVVAKARGRYRRVLDGSVYGWNFAFTRQAPHFAHESYLRCGYGREYANGAFDNIVFDKIPELKWKQIAEEHIKKGVRNVALSLNGNSSPLPGVDGYREQITKHLTDSGANVIDVSHFRLPCVVDLLAIFRECDLVITSDTSTAWLMGALPSVRYILMKNNLFGGDKWYGAYPFKANCVSSYWYSDMPSEITHLISVAKKSAFK